jgi:pimeloyl-ACP methyl ester carboxylesterase
MKSTLSSPEKKTTRRRRSCLGILGRGLLVLMTVLILSIPIGAGFQAYALRRELAAYPPPGQLVDVGGFRLHLYCTGPQSVEDGTPTVILESGLGDGGFIWARVQEGVAQTARVCAYDRPGLGWSDFVSQPFDGGEVAENLHKLLVNAGVRGPYVLVGHSMGGLYIREFAWHYPQEVAGLVFVDSVHEQQSRQSEGGRGGGFGAALDNMLSFCSAIAPTGVFRFFGVGNALIEDTGLPAEVQAAAIASINRNSYCDTIANEMNTSDADTNQSHGPKSLGDIPLIVLVAGQGFADDPGNGPPGMSEEEARQSDSRWLRLQRELAELSTSSRLVIAERSSHYIHLDQPDLVIASIVELARQSVSNPHP